MESEILKKTTTFRLKTDLLERLKELARNQHRSLNNLVELILLEAAWCEPNEETMEAMREAKSGANRDANPIDTSSVDAMLKSMGI